MKILIVEDDRTLNDGIALSLGRENVRQAYGLYLAREILTKEGGYIKVSSQPSEGSCFSIFLPRN